MKILVTAIYDDNFGDMLIRTNFVSLLKVAAENMNISDSTEILQMDLKNVDEELVKKADCIIFAGGGIFGLSYLGLSQYLDKIVTIADESNIPVYFSSMGVVNMDAQDGNDKILKEILSKPCVKGISVREKAELFADYLTDCNIKAEPVCDPAVWTKYVYHNHISEKPSKPVVGINAVRGGLFNANGKSWKLKDEMNYLTELKALLDGENIDYKFYTNGNILDDNSLKFWARENDIPDDKIVCVNSSKELVSTISGFSAIASIRLHSSIVAYSCGVPAINIEWNDKVKWFYDNIGYKDRCLPESEFTPENVFALLKAFLNGEGVEADKDYMMSLYAYILRILSECTESNAPAFTFDEICAKLSNYTIPDSEDLLDALRKVWRCEKDYLVRFTEVREKTSENNKLIKEKDALEKKLEKANSEIADKNKQIESKNKKLDEQKALITKQEAKLKSKQAELDRIYSKLPVRIYLKLKRTIKRILGKKN